MEFTENDFKFLKENLLSIGFHLKGEINFKKDFQRLGLEAPRKLTGREQGFFFTENGLTVKVWTTYLEKEKKFRDIGEDMGWVLITEGDTAIYFAKPIKRTTSFIQNLLRKAWIAKWRVQNRPLCKQCKSYMDVKSNKMRQYFWGCFNNVYHHQNEPVFLGWDSIGPDGNLPKKAKAYTDSLRKKIILYKKRDKKLGIIRTPARKIRKPWPITKPENKI